MPSYTLKTTETLSSVLFDNNPLPCLVIHAASLQVTSINKKAQLLLGLGKEAPDAPLFLSLLHPKDQPRFMALLEEVPACTDLPAVFALAARGRTVTAELLVQPFAFHHDHFYQVVLTDISGRDDRLKKQQESNVRYKTFVEQSTAGIFCYEYTDPIPVHLPFEELVNRLKTEGMLTECNDAMARMYGYKSARELHGSLPDELIDFSDPANTEYVKAFVQNGFKITNAPTHERDRSGKSVYFLNNLLGIVEGGCLQRIWGTQQDITEKNEAEEKVALLAGMVEQTSDVLITADLKFSPIIWNRAAEKIFGIPAEKIIGRNVRDFLDISYQDADVLEVRSLIKSRGEWRGEMFFTRKTDNRKVTLLIHFKLLKDKQGVPLHYLVSGTDISEIKEVESKIKESENRFREVADSAPVGIWMSGPDRKLAYLNKQLAAYTGSSPAEFDRLTYADFIYPEDLAAAMELFVDHYNKKLPVTLVYRLRNQSGAYRWVQDTMTPRFLENGQFMGYIGSIVDIHDSKTNEEELQYQATILENVLDSIVTMDLKFNVRSMNRVAEAIYGKTAAEAIGRPFHHLVAFTYTACTPGQALRSLTEAGVWIGEVAFEDGMGETRHFLNTTTYVYDRHKSRTGIMSVSREITDRKRVEEKLRQSELFYRSLIADSLDGMLLVDADGTINFSSPSITPILGYEKEDALGKSAFDFVHPDDLGAAAEAFQKEVAQNPEIKSIVVRLRKKNGEWLWCMVRGHNLLNNPYIKSIVVYFHDDTLRKTASDALRESEARFRTLIRDLKLGVTVEDAGGNLLMYNKAALHLLGADKGAPEGKKVYKLITGAINENGKPFKQSDWPTLQAIKTKRPVDDVVIGINGRQPKDRVWLLVNANPVLDEEGHIVHVISTLTDVTERKKLEQNIMEERIKQQKLLTQATIDGQENERREIGKELHDNIGQQLTTTKLYLDLAKTTANDTTNEMICLALKSIADVINEIRGISHALVPSTIGDLGLVDSVQELIDSITIVQPLEVRLEAGGFTEEGMPENKKLMLYRIIQEQLNNIVKHAGARQVSIALKQNRQAFTLEVRDDGNGFVMKNVRKGLGLTNIKNRAELFGGKVDIQSAPGKGCTLKVSFPGLPAPVSRRK